MIKKSASADFLFTKIAGNINIWRKNHEEESDYIWSG